jgi:hypothetical protein
MWHSTPGRLRRNPHLVPRASINIRFELILIPTSVLPINIQNLAPFDLYKPSMSPLMHFCTSFVGTAFLQLFTLLPFSLMQNINGAYNTRSRNYPIYRVGHQANCAVGICNRFIQFRLLARPAGRASRLCHPCDVPTNWPCARPALICHR